MWDKNSHPPKKVKTKSARGVIDSQTLQIKRFENVKKTLRTQSFSFKNSTKSTPKTHFMLYVGANARKSRIQVRGEPSPGVPREPKKTTKIDVWRGGRSRGAQSTRKPVLREARKNANSPKCPWPQGNLTKRQPSEMKGSPKRRSRRKRPWPQEKRTRLKKVL